VGSRSVAAQRYASIGGKLNPKQPSLIIAAIARMCAEIVAAIASWIMSSG
jgi:hypothetical protein